MWIYLICCLARKLYFMNQFKSFILVRMKSKILWIWTNIFQLVYSYFYNLCLLRKPQRLTFSTGIKFNSQIFSSVPVEMNSNPVLPNWKSVSRTWFLWEQVSLCGFRSLWCIGEFFSLIFCCFLFRFFFSIIIKGYKEGLFTRGSQIMVKHDRPDNCPWGLSNDP